MKPADTLTTLFSHHLWANVRLLERCAALTSEQLDTRMAGAYGSIRDTLQHIVTSEQSYFSRISTGQRRSRPEDAPPLTLAEMLESARATGSGLIEWASKVQAGDTVRIDWDGTPRDVPKTILLTQAINHATEHRAQVMTIMTQLGIQPPESDGWTYFDERGIHKAEETPTAQFDLIGIVARDMAASLRFYRLLGLDIPSESESEPHVEVALPGGLRLAWDSLEMIRGIYPDWIDPVGQRIALAFKCHSPSAVDALYDRVLRAGYVGHKAPWDAFWGQRYAVVADPDGNLVDVFAAL